jgi:hypothetical protein
MSKIHKHWTHNCSDEELTNLLELLVQLEDKGHQVPSASAAIREEGKRRGLYDPDIGTMGVRGY